MATFQPEGRIYLVKDVDIDVSYTHQYYFRNTDAQLTFFQNKTFKTLENGTYQRKNINTIQVPYQADEIRECKYLFWENPDYSYKYYYAFVTSIDYINPGVSQINYQLDVYQTYLFDMNWKQSFIERQHTQRYLPNGQPVVNTLDENLDYGTEYDVVARDTVFQEPDVAFCIIGTTDVDDAYQYGTLHTNLGYRIVPVWLGDTNRTFYTTWDGGTGTQTYELASLKEVFTQFRTNTELVNSMISCVMLPYLCIEDLEIEDRGEVTQRIFITSPRLKPRWIPGTSNPNKYSLMIQRNQNDDPYIVYERPMGGKYEHFTPYEESKLLMYPYSFMEMTTNRGDSKLIKLEYINDLNVNIGICGTVSFRNKMAYIVKNYLSEDYKINNALVDNSNESVPIIDDYSASYLQANSNAVSVAMSNAQLLQQTQIDNAQKTYHTGMDNLFSNMLGGTFQSATDIIGGFIPGSGGSVVGGINRGIDTLVDYKTGSRSAQTSYLNSSRSANTDYQMSIASTLAKIRDAEQVPASSRSLGGDYMFDYAYSCNRLYLVYKTIKPEYRDKLTAYFKQYGYKVNSLEVPNFHTRASWNYIKMKEPNVYGNIPMDDLMRIRDIFLKGITLWHGDYIGDYSRNNSEI